jgi:tRNA pseudouridine38-40 synthase
LCQLNRKIKLTIEYEGTAYQGWQLQASGPTIQGRLQETLTRITGETMAVVGSGRTDSGVHAEAQVAHFRTA